MVILINSLLFKVGMKDLEPLNQSLKTINSMVEEGLMMDIPLMELC
jgi:hypothetical protein